MTVSRRHHPRVIDTVNDCLSAHPAVRRRRVPAVQRGSGSPNFQVADVTIRQDTNVSQGSGSSGIRRFPEISEADDALAVALKCASAGIATVATARGDSKNPSSVDRDWTHASTMDPQVLALRYATKNYGVGIHVGASRLLVFDVDHPALLPAMMSRAFERDRPPFQSTRTNEPGRGHYVYQMPEGLTLGNGTGALGGAWGEVRGQNGFIALTPSVHAKGLIAFEGVPGVGVSVAG